MSWLFSQALVAEYSAGTSLAGELSAPLSVMPTPHKFWRNDKTMEPSKLSQFGLTCAVLTDAHGEALLTSYLAASRARTSAQLAPVKASTESAVACGSTWPALSVKYDPNSSSWKTAHCLWEEDLPWSSVTLPPWGMTRNGSVFQHPTSERPISATGVGYWATPSATDGTRGGCITENMTGISLAQQINTPDRWPTPSAMIVDAKSSVVKLSGRTPKDPQVGLADKVMAVEARRWPTATATATASKGWSPNHNRANSDDRLDYTVERESFMPGQETPPMRLNPEWVEWLMGWPLGWTDLKPLAMDRFREWQRQHSPCFLEIEGAA